MAKIVTSIPSSTNITNHNSLPGLNEGDYLHLTQLEKDGLTFVPSNYDLEDFTNIGVDPYLKQSDVISGSANLSYLASPLQGVVISDTGTDATIPLANVTNAGLLSPSEKSDISTALQPGDIPAFAPSDYDLEDFTNVGADPFVYTSDLSGLVPYIGAIADVNIGEYQIKVGQLEFDQTPTGTLSTGKVRWNDSDGTIELMLKGGNVTLQIGQELLTRVVNKTGVNLLESQYKVVYISGAQGNRLKCGLAMANNDIFSNSTLGLVTENINNNNEGFVTSSGLVRGINTTGSLQGETWLEGDVLYLSPTIPGQLTNIVPIAPDHLTMVGYVVNPHITQGSIYVKVQIGYGLDALHNVLITTPLNNDALIYESATSLWKNKPVTTVLGYIPENIVNKQNSLAVDGTGTKYPTVDAVNAALPKSYSQIVYVNSTNPNTATIFDTVNPPVTNNNVLKTDVNNLYIGTDASTWVYDLTIFNYVTKSLPAVSNFYISGSSADAGNNKINPIYRVGTIQATGFIKSDGFSSQFLKADGSSDSTSYQPILVSGTNIKTLDGDTLLGSGNITTLKVIQVTAQTLTAASWTLVSGLYEYNLANANITTTSIVDIIPDNAYVSIIQVAQVLPKTLSGSGTVKLYSTNLPTGNIIVTLNIWK